MPAPSPVSEPAPTSMALSWLRMWVNEMVTSVTPSVASNAPSPPFSRSMWCTHMRAPPS